MLLKKLLLSNVSNAKKTVLNQRRTCDRTNFSYSEIYFRIIGFTLPSFFSISVYTNWQTVSELCDNGRTDKLICRCRCEPKNFFDMNRFHLCIFDLTIEQTKSYDESNKFSDRGIEVYLLALLRKHARPTDQPSSNRPAGGHKGS